ncbi:hypothetical protein HYFRA_00003966 [Hymenoscyphus fraxineus]|uniref:Uncharacterized protein n=1 Tax=Hymenoscyphus fraxineus TaxID=746836 RepID=A0A9N9L3Y3_9HELO|nr:hypothetical protein HYFRA_00003966 [Hymenoscyphus fraxineus]
MCAPLREENFQQRHQALVSQLEEEIQQAIEAEVARRERARHEERARRERVRREERERRDEEERERRRRETEEQEERALAHAQLVRELEREGERRERRHSLVVVLACLVIFLHDREWFGLGRVFWAGLAGLLGGAFWVLGGFEVF